MPWVRASFKGKTVFARASDDGALAVERGLVEIRFKLGDARAYRARADGLSVVDSTLVADGEFPDGVKPEPDKATGNAPKRGAKSGSSAHAVPVSLEGAIVAYTDGACTGNPGPAGLGVVVLDGARIVELSEYLGVGTNNIAELTAVLRAVEAAPDASRPLVVHTDSQYAIGVLSKGWKAKANTDLIASIKRALAARPRVSFVYVRGHSGIPLNERADELARDSIVHRSRRLVEAAVAPAQSLPISNEA